MKMLQATLVGLAVLLGSGYLGLTATDVLAAPDPPGNAFGLRGDPPGNAFGLSGDPPGRGGGYAVPIPGTLLLFGAGFGSFVAWHWRERRKNNRTS